MNRLLLTLAAWGVPALLSLSPGPVVPKAPGPRMSAITAPVTADTYGVTWEKQPDGTWRCPLKAGPVTIDGVRYQIDLRLIPVPTPPPLPASVYGVLSAKGDAIRGGTAGDTVLVQGVNLGTSGQAQVAGQPATVRTWTDTGVTIVLPAPPPPNRFAVGKIVLITAAGQAVTSVFDFSITAP